jgi:hypothetical protein
MSGSDTTDDMRIIGHLIIFLKRFIAKKVCTACLRANKIVPLTNLNKYLYNCKSEIKVSVINSGDKNCLKTNTT